jgi:hypothetical protein
MSAEDLEARVAHMQPISNEEFLKWAALREIAADARYSPPRCLTYLPNRPHHRFWAVPERAAAIPFFVDHLLAGMDPWSECYLWPRAGVGRNPTRHIG